MSSLWLEYTSETSDFEGTVPYLSLDLSHSLAQGQSTPEPLLIPEVEDIGPETVATCIHRYPGLSNMGQLSLKSRCQGGSVGRECDKVLKDRDVHSTQPVLLLLSQPSLASPQSCVFSQHQYCGMIQLPVQWPCLLWIWLSRRSHIPSRSAKYLELMLQDVPVWAGWSNLNNTQLAEGFEHKRS